MLGTISLPSVRHSSIPCVARPSGVVITTVERGRGLGLVLVRQKHRRYLLLSTGASHSSVSRDVYCSGRSTGQAPSHLWCNVNLHPSPWTIRPRPQRLDSERILPSLSSTRGSGKTLVRVDPKAQKVLLRVNPSRSLPSSDILCLRDKPTGVYLRDLLPRNDCQRIILRYRGDRRLQEHVQ